MWLCAAAFAFTVCFVSASGGIAEKAVFAFEELEYSVYVGKTITVKPVSQNIKGEPKYEWISSDVEVATVKGGKVKGVSPGTSEIICKATFKNGDVYTASYDINVLQAVEKIIAKETEVMMGTWWGSTLDEDLAVFTPELTIIPENASNKEIEWSLSKYGVVITSGDGTFVGTLPGNVTITGKAADGQGAKVKIKVNIPDVLATETKVVLKEKEPYLFGYQICGESSPEPPKSEKGYFEIEEVEERDGMTWIYLKPIKSGTDYLKFVTFYGNAKIKVTIEHSAVYDNVSYPKGKVSKLIKDQEGSIGKQVNFEGKVVSESDEYTFLKTGKQEYIAIIRDEDLKIGDEITVYGEVDSFVEYRTETGLEYDCPLMTNGIYRK